MADIWWSIKYLFLSIYHIFILLYSPFCSHKFVSESNNIIRHVMLHNLSWNKMSFTTLCWVTWQRHKTWFRLLCLRTLNPSLVFHWNLTLNRDKDSVFQNQLTLKGFKNVHLVMLCMIFFFFSLCYTKELFMTLCVCVCVVWTCLKRLAMSPLKCVNIRLSWYCTCHASTTKEKQ